LEPPEENAVPNARAIAMANTLAASEQRLVDTRK